jgi:hypothetical protein
MRIESVGRDAPRALVCIHGHFEVENDEVDELAE